MIEYVYRENAKETGPEPRLELPKNVRQMGEPDEHRRIYIEDYVITYLRRMAGEQVLSSRVAILFGQAERMDGLPYLFIKGAACLKDVEYTESGIPFTDEVWADIYRIMKEYFPRLDILGWFLSLPGYPMELGPEITGVHLNYFGGVDKVLLVEEPSDGEEDFYAYENGRLCRQRGYCIFYEKNEDMQRYMIETGDGESIDEKEHFEDRAMKSFRAIVQEKKELSGQKRAMTYMYAASTFLVMVILVIGITLINNYEKMEGLEMTLSEITRSLENQEELTSAYTDGGQEEDSGKESVSENTLGNDFEETGTDVEETAAPQQPDADTETVAEESTETEPAASEAVAAVPESYVVKKGDTLLKISRKIYGRDDEIQAICDLNGIEDSDHILEGQKLLLP